ncbi:MAG: alpha/beta fold hydrolase [Pseudomonadales bacterium]|nr:alpha/beta fold hydrolase [Pseudomonadales bacterium]
MNRIITPLLSLLLLVFQPALAQPSDFYEEGEQREGWYHSYDMETWVAKGGDPAVIEAVLERIEASEGAKHHPDLVDTQIEYGPGNWSYEWVQAGDAAHRESSALDGDARLQKLLEALTYYSTGSWPHLGRSDDRRAYEKSVQMYLEAGKMLAIPVEHIELDVGQNTVKAYLHLPPGEGPFPLVINSFGSDVSKEDSFELFNLELSARNIAMLAVDMPGLGEASHLSMADGSDAVMEGALNWARSSAAIENDQVYIVGGSFGGNAAARAFYRLPVAGVVSMCGPLHSPFMAPPEFLDQLPLLTIEGVKSRYKVLGEPTSTLASLTPNTSLVQQGLMASGQQVSTPLLIITTNRDPVAPLEDLEMLLADASNKEVIVLDQDGHCPPRTAREPIIARWVDDQIRANRNQL